MGFYIRAVYEEKYDKLILKYPKLLEWDIRKLENGECVISINSFEDLRRLRKELDNAIVIDDYGDEFLYMTIYDDYME
jgi:hypothetical protein